MKRFLILLLAVLCLSFLGCGNREGGPTPTPEIAVNTDGAVPQENLMFIPADVGKNYFSDTQGDGLYCASNGVLSYYDIESGSSAILCPQTGCGHNREICPAYLDGAQNMVIYQGNIYTVTETADERALKVARCSLGQTDRVELCQIPASEGTYVHLSSGRISHGNIFLTVIERDEGNQERYCLWSINAENGTVLELTSGNSGEYINFYGASSNMAAVEWRTYTGRAPQENDYKNYEDYIAAWDTFEKTHGLLELRLYDLDRDTFTVLADSKADGYLQPTDFRMCLDDLLLYRLGNSLWTYDLSTGKKKLQLTQVGLINYMFLDDKLLMITQDESGARGCYLAELDGEPIPLASAMNEGRMRFSAAYETPHYFVGIFAGNSGYYKISKTDFYAGRYENVTLVSKWD